MERPNGPNALSTANDKTGQPARRREDERFVTGRGTFTDDIHVEGQVYAHVVRSEHAHGVLHAVDIVEAARMPGVLGIFTGEDLAAAGIEPIRYLPIPGFNLDGLIDTPRPALARGHVRYVGEQIALVVAENHAQATEAAERVRVDIEPLPAAATIEAATALGAAPLWPAARGNCILDWHYGDTAALDAAFANAAHVTRLTLTNNRVVANPMEPRAIIADYDRAADLFNLTVCCQGVVYYRRGLSEATFKLAPERMHLRTHDVGGAFGAKEFPYPEDIAVMHAARALGRPVKWTGTRMEHLLSDNHARDATIDCELALAGDGSFLAVRATVHNALGAYCSYVAPITPIRNTTFALPMVYRTPLIGATHRMIVTNTAPTGPYRGAGREQSVLIMESLIEQAARELKIDAIDLRRRNLLPNSAIPHRTPTNQLYDSGDFDGLLNKALALADWDGFDARAEADRKAGRMRGRGMAFFVEPVGGVPFEGALIRFAVDGMVEAVVATQSHGQGHETSFAQVIAERLGVPLECIRLRQGDSFDVPRGMGSFASRSMIMAGAALSHACDAVIENGRIAAAHLLGVAADEITFDDGLFRAANSNLVIELTDLAARLHAARDLPVNVPARLDATGDFVVKDFHHAMGCHVCEVVIDPGTGVVSVDRYAAVDDVGRVINPMIVHGQLHGGIAQGLGQALLEHCVYEPGGQLVTASFTDYALPVAASFPEPALAFNATLSPSNPLGVKGCGESGVTGSVAAVSNAVNDALARAGCPRRVTLPFTSEKIWRALGAIGTNK